MNLKWIELLKIIPIIMYNRNRVKFDLIFFFTSKLACPCMKIKLSVISIFLLPYERRKKNADPYDSTEHFSSRDDRSYTKQQKR